MNSSVTALLLLCATSQASAGAATPKEQYQALRKEYEAADRQWNKTYNVNVRPPAKVDWETRYRAKPSLVIRAAFHQAGRDESRRSRGS